MATKSEVQKGFDFLDAKPKYRRVTANTLIMSDAVHAENRPITPEVLRQIFARIQSKLAMNAEYAEAYGTFFNRHPEYRLEANLALLDSALALMGLPVVAENLEDLIQPGNPHNIVHQLVIIAAAQEARAEAAHLKAEAEHQARETDRMISEITGYMLGSDGKVKREYTQRQYNDKIAGLRALSFAALVNRHSEVTAGRDLRKTPVEAVRAVVKTEAQAQRKDIFSIEPPEIELINPKTKLPFTGRKELMNYFNSLPPSENRNFFFHAGSEPRRPKSGVQEAVTKILRSGMVK